MPHQLRSETFKNIGSLNKEIKGLQFDKTIDFYQHQDPNPIPITNMSREQWGCGILALNGKIYGLPLSGNIPANILEFDPDTNRHSLIPVTNSSGETWFGGTLASNGKIYGLPGSGNIPAYILEFDPDTKTNSLIPVTNSSSETWVKGILAPNGKIYGVPGSGNITSDILEFRRTFPQLMSDWILYPQFNKL